MFAEKCPICFGEKYNPVLKESLFKKCSICGVVFNSSYKTIPYNDNYFTSEYEAQYGKTYEQDFDNIYNFAKKRLKKIYSLKKKKKNFSSMFDIGCALGFFLKAAFDWGIKDVSGLEISQYASDYCKKTFGFPIINSSFEDYEIKDKYDLISAWYFVEHCQQPCDIFEKCFNSLNPEGIFAFSVPSINGPMFKFNRNAWSNTHPEDHLVDFSPKCIKRILKKIGFRKVKIYPSGVHPERIINRKSWFFPFFSRIYTFLSRIFIFSDTIEVYAVK